LSNKFASSQLVGEKVKKNPVQIPQSSVFLGCNKGTP
jgi:hypothetical protein